MRGQIDAAIADLIAFLEAEKFEGWEPYEIPVAFLESCHWHPLRVACTQLFRLSPFYFHTRLTAKKMHAKAAALFAQAFLTLYQLSGEPSCRDRATFYLDWLIAHRSSLSRNFSIGNQYPLSMKSYAASPGTPAPLITCLAIDAFLLAYEIFGEVKYLTLAESGIHYFLEELPLVKKSTEEWYFIYHPNNHQFIPNIPAVISGTLAHGYVHLPEPAILPLVRHNLNCVVRAQQADGSWPYHPTARYTDSFHTAFILNGIAKFRCYVDPKAYAAPFQKGLQFYLKSFFNAKGRPRHKRCHGFPSNVDSLLTQIDLRDCAMALILFSRLMAQQQLGLELPSKVLNWATNHFRSAQGHFYYQRIPMVTIRGPFLSMQAWMLNALSQLKYANDQIINKRSEEA